MKSKIINSIKICKDRYESKGIIFNEKLINTVYIILKSYFIDNKRFVLLQAPTGTGKSIIGLILSECVKQILEINEKLEPTAYYITSSKILQLQLENDIKKFELNDVSILKGTDNYICEPGKNNNPPLTYKYRLCYGCKPEDLNTLFANCINICEYRNARNIATIKNMVITNYHYWLNVLNMNQPIYFNDRFLTICDEAHKISDIVSDSYSITLTKKVAIKLAKLIPDASILYEYFDNDNDIDLKKCCEDHINMISEVLKIGNIPIDLEESFKRDIDKLNYIIQSFEERPEDIFIEKQQLTENLYKIVIKDLNDTHILQEKFIKHINKGLFMSATMGNLQEFEKIYGMDHNDTVFLSIDNGFDYTKSKIYLCNSGSLTRNNFNYNIDYCLDTVKYIVEYLHPNDKGIIHTHTNNITEMLENKCRSDRYLFYKNSEEKDEKLEKLINSDYPYVLVGPSITEGLDLKGDLGRFNILIKVPYPPMNNFAKRKMKYQSFWYDRTTKEAIIQSIGRTNRSKNDQSSTYLIDSKFQDLIFEIDDNITSRVQKLYLKDDMKINKTQYSFDEYITDDLPFE